MNKRDQFIKEKYMEGKTLQDIKDKLGLSRQRIHQIISSWESGEYIKRKHNEIRQENLKERNKKIRELYRNGERLTNIANDFELSISRILNIINYKE